MADAMTQEGFIPVTGGRIWYQIVGSGDAIPLLTLHGVLASLIAIWKRSLAWPTSAP